MLLPPNTGEKFSILKKNNIKIAIISGRNIKNIINLFNNISVNYLCGLNGSVIYNCENKKIENLFFINKEIIYEFIHFIKHLNISFFIFTIDNVYFFNGSENIKLNSYQQSLELIDISYLKDYENILSIDISIKNYNILKKIKNIINKNFCSCLSLTYSGYNYYQIINKNINKGECLKILANKLNIDISETIAIGDSENDLPMLEIAGIGILMKNSNKKIKNKIKYITDKDNHNNGAIDYIFKFLKL